MIQLSLQSYLICESSGIIEMLLKFNQLIITSHTHIKSLKKTTSLAYSHDHNDIDHKYNVCTCVASVRKSTPS